MKKIYYILMSILMLGFASCSNEDGIDHGYGDGLKFVHFATSGSGSWTVDQDEVVDVTVACTKTSAEARTINISLDATSTAVENRDFAFVGNKSVTIPAGEYTGTFQIKILHDTMIKSSTAVLAFAADESEINPVYGNTTSLTFNYFTVDWSYLSGNWDETMYDADGAVYYESSVYRPSYGTDVDVVIAKTGDNTCTIYNIWWEEVTTNATVDFDEGKIYIDPFGFVGSAPFWYTSLEDYKAGVTTPTTKIVANITTKGIEIPGYAIWDPATKTYKVSGAHVLTRY